MSLSAILFLFLVHLGVGITPRSGLGWARGGGEVFPLQRRHGRAAHRDRFCAAARGGKPEARFTLPRSASLLVGRGRAASCTGRRSAGCSRRFGRRCCGRPSSPGSICRHAAGARHLARRAGIDAAPDRRQLSQFGGAARRRLRRDGARPLVSRRAVARRRRTCSRSSGCTSARPSCASSSSPPP